LAATGDGKQAYTIVTGLCWEQYGGC